MTRKVVSDTYPSGLTTTLAFDKLNRQISQTDPAVADRVTGAVHTKKTTFTFDDDGNASAQTVQDLTGGDASRTASATFNAHDQQITATDPANNTTNLGYDAYGNKNKVIDAAGVETDYAYDADGRLLTTTLKGWTGDPVNPTAPTDLVRESRAYDPAGRLASVTDSMGWLTSYTYTDDGLVATITRSDPAHPGTGFVQESDTYDAAGNPVNQATNNGVTTSVRSVDAANRTVSSTVDPAGVNRTTTYAYSPDDAVLSTRTSGSSGSTTVDATYDLMGRMTSQSVDNNVTTNSPTGWWKLNETSGTVASDASGAQQTGMLNSGVSWTGGGAASATFDGTSGAITTAGPVLNTANDFSVSAWVNISTLSGFPVAVSQDAVHNAGFYLEYSSSLNKWAFVRTPNDTNAGGSLYAASNSAPSANTWVHLVGTYKVSNGQLTLYVNGASQTTTGTDTTPFNATGPLAIGRAKYTDTVGQYFPGQIANVQVYPRLLTSTEVSTLYSNGRTGGALSTTRMTTTWTLDKRGLPTASTDPNGNTTSYTYDEAGQLAITTAPTVNTEANGGAAVPANPAVLAGYDTFGAKTESEDANGNVTVTAYDATGRPTSVTSPSYTPPGGTTITATSHKTYNSRGLVDTVTDPLNHQTTYGYDQMGRAATVTAPNLGVTHYTYDLDGDRLSVTDPNGAVTQNTYDYLGRAATATQVVRQPSTNSYTTTYAYNTTGGWLSSVTTPGNVATTYSYDNLGERASVTDAASNVTSYTYDYAGRTTRTALPDNTALTATFDSAGRQTGAAKLDTDGTTVLASMSTVFDGDGNATSVTDARGHVSTFTYDATNMLTGEVQPISASASITTSFGYDAAGHRTRFTDGRGNAFITTYNTWGLPESTIEPSTTAYPNAVDRTFTTAYDVNGRVASQTSPGGVVVTNTYDALGDLTGQTGSGADATTTARTFGYDTGGRLTSVSAPGGTDTFTLDDRGLLLSASGPSGSSSFAYNGDGLMTSRADASGTSSYTYDTDDRLKTITDASTSAVLTYSYNPLSQPSGITYGAGADTRSFGYDHLHRLTSDTFKTNAGSTIASISYGYDANDNETSKATVGFSGASSNTYTYDWADRLLSWNNGSATSNYAYDNSGNRTQSGTQTFAYNARNELTAGAGSTYTYTARGTLASVVTGSTTVNTTNDAFGQAVTQGNQTYAYDALGRVVTDATSGGGTRTFSYTDTGNDVAGDGTSTYSRGPGGGLVGVKTGTAGVLAWTDLHTDVVGQFTTTGTSLAGSTTYGPLGTIVASSGMTGNLGYQSGFTEFNTGRVNMAARWYNPATGQFDNRDSVANAPTPDSANADRYAYANDNPLTATDPSGHIAAANVDSGAEPNSRKPTDQYRRPPPPPAPAPRPTTPSAPPTITNITNPMACPTRLCHDQQSGYVDDVRNKINQQIHDAQLAAMHCPLITCYNSYQTAIANGDYNSITDEYGRTTTLSNDGHTVTTVTDLNRLKAVTAQKEAQKAAAAKAAACEKNWWCKHAGLVGAIAGIAAGVGCGLLLGWTGLAAIGCGFLGGFVSSMTTGLLQGKSLSDGSLWVDGLIGGAIGALGAGVGAGVGSLIGKALTPMLEQGLSTAAKIGIGAASGAISGGVAGAATGVAGYGVGCLSTGHCTASGFASAATTGATMGAVFGAAGGAIGGYRAAVKGKAPVDENTGCTPKSNSFDPATPVLMADKSAKAIKDIKVGDKVVATDPRTGNTTGRTVTQLHNNLDTDLTDLTLSTAPPPTLKAFLGFTMVAAPVVVHTTDHHPFWDVTAHRWVAAADLRPGHRLLSATGRVAYIIGVHSYIGRKRMLNLTVAGIHTYYVIAGTTPVLVHNCGGARFVVDSDGVATDRAVPDPLPQYRPSGAPDRSSAVYINVVDENGNVITVGSRPGGFHAEDIAQQRAPGGQMSRPFGWRRDPGTGQLTWQPINVCTICQGKYPPELFPPATGADSGGVWGQ